MKAAEVISSLKARGVDLWQEGDALRYRAPAGALTEEEIAALKAYKDAILKALTLAPISPPTFPGSEPSWEAAMRSSECRIPAVSPSALDAVISSRRSHGHE